MLRKKKKDQGGRVFLFFLSINHTFGHTKREKKKNHIFGMHVAPF